MVQSPIICAVMMHLAMRRTSHRNRMQAAMNPDAGRLSCSVTRPVGASQLALHSLPRKLCPASSDLQPRKSTHQAFVRIALGNFTVGQDFAESPRVNG